MTDVRNRKRDDISIGVVERFFTAFDIVQPCTVQEFCTKLGVYRQKSGGHHGNTGIWLSSFITN